MQVDKDPFPKPMAGKMASIKQTISQGTAKDIEAKKGSIDDGYEAEQEIDNESASISSMEEDIKAKDAQEGSGKTKEAINTKYYSH